MIWLVFGLLLFHGLHSLRMFAPAWRDAKYAEFGEAKWKGIYSLFSLIALVLVIWGYSQARFNTSILYDPPAWGVHPAIALMLAAFVLMTFNMRSSRFRSVTHHPFLTAIILWSIAHLLVNGDTASVLLFGSFLVWAIANYHFVRKRGDGLPPVQPLVQDMAAIVFGIVLWAVFLWKAHEWLFGVSPIA
jgi:uncharacterized membrane protein